MSYNKSVTQKLLVREVEGEPNRAGISLPELAEGFGDLDKTSEVKDNDVPTASSVRK